MPPAALTVDWALLFDLPGRAPAQRSKRIDGRLARSLIRLPLAITGDVAVDPGWTPTLARGDGSDFGIGTALDAVAP